MDTRDTEFENEPTTSRRCCSGMNLSEDSSEDSIGDDGRKPLLSGNSNHTYIEIEPEFDVTLDSDTISNFPKEPGKALLSVSILFVTGVLNDFVLSFIHERVPNTPPLRDIAFDQLPYIPFALQLSEYLMLSSFAIMVLITIFHRHRWIVLRRIAFIGSLLYLGRCVTMFLTQVPVADPNYYCSPKLKENERTLWNIFFRSIRVFSGLGLKINGKHTLCGDYIYSGHTIVFVVTSLFICEYSPRKWKLLHYFSIILSLIGVSLLLVSRAHYSIDIVISYWISTRVFWIYHTLAACPSLKKRNGHHNKLSNVIWYRVFLFMEKNVNRPVPRRFGWPFSIGEMNKRSSFQSRKSNIL